MKDVQWTATARRTLYETSDFIIKIWNSTVNEEFLQQLDYRINQLQQNPELGVSFKKTQIRRLLIHKTVSLYYMDTTRYIKLLVIWDNRQDPNKLLEKLIDSNN